MSPNAVAAVALAVLLGQAAASRFAGTWTVSLEGQPLARLELQTTRVALAGRSASAPCI